MTTYLTLLALLIAHLSFAAPDTTAPDSLSWPGPLRASVDALITASRMSDVTHLPATTASARARLDVLLNGYAIDFNFATFIAERRFRDTRQPGHELVLRYTWHTLAADNGHWDLESAHVMSGRDTERTFEAQGFRYGMIHFLGSDVLTAAREDTLAAYLPFAPLPEYVAGHELKPGQASLWVLDALLYTPTGAPVGAAYVRLSAESSTDPATSPWRIDQVGMMDEAEKAGLVSRPLWLRLQTHADLPTPPHPIQQFAAQQMPFGWGMPSNTQSYPPPFGTDIRPSTLDQAVQALRRQLATGDTTNTGCAEAEACMSAAARAELMRLLSTGVYLLDDRYATVTARKHFATNRRPVDLSFVLRPGEDVWLITGAESEGGELPAGLQPFASIPSVPAPSLGCTSGLTPETFLALAPQLDLDTEVTLSDLILTSRDGQATVWTARYVRREDGTWFLDTFRPSVTAYFLDGAARRPWIDMEQGWAGRYIGRGPTTFLAPKHRLAPRGPDNIEWQGVPASER